MDFILTCWAVQIPECSIEWNCEGWFCWSTSQCILSRTYYKDKKWFILEVVYVLNLSEKNLNKLSGYSTKTTKDEIKSNQLNLTVGNKLVHLNHQTTLITEQHLRTTFIEFRSHEESNHSKALSTWVIVYLDVDSEWNVLQVSESRRKFDQKLEVWRNKNLKNSLKYLTSRKTSKKTSTLQIHHHVARSPFP